MYIYVMFKKKDYIYGLYLINQKNFKDVVLLIVFQVGDKKIVLGK